jgi:hypothetical protein
MTNLKTTTGSVPFPKNLISIADEVRNQIIAVCTKASADDKKRISEIIAQAKRGEFMATVAVITPPMAAILFLEYNPHNRDWRPDGPRSCREYSRRMTAGQWKKNNATVGFYCDGQIEDGQHRLSAAALAGYTLEVTIVFGIQRDAIVTVDDGLARHGSDHAKLNGILNASVKQTIIKTAAAYLVKAGDKDAALKSEAEIFEAIKMRDALLDEAIEIGKASGQNIVEPVLKDAAAATLTYLMLTNAWPAQRIREKLALFQTGVDNDGEKTPFFVAAEVIKTARKKSEAKDRLSGVKELGVAVYAMTAAERGVRALSSGTLRGAIKKELPNPAFPIETMSAAA